MRRFCPSHVSELTQPVEQRRKARLVLCPWNGLQDADGVDLRLRVCRERPRRRLAKPRDELPPPCMSGKEHSEG